MKKFISLILSLLVASAVCLGVAGCGEKDPINYTATEPYLQYKFNYDNNNNLLSISSNERSYLMRKKTNEFYEFSQYYKDNFAGNKMYILDYGLEIPPWAVSNDNGYWRAYFLFEEKETSELLIREHFYLYDKDLGNMSPTKKATGITISMALSVFIKPINAYINNKFVLEFGKSKDRGKFINIYSDNECFATCYFDSGKVKVTEDWFENYFTQNLIWGDSL